MKSGVMGRWGPRTDSKKRVPRQEAAMWKGRGLNWGPAPLQRANGGTEATMYESVLALRPIVASGTLKVPAPF